MNDRARDLLDRAVDKAACKRLGAEVDEGGAPLKAALIALAAARGVELPEDAAEWPGKKLLRWARGASESAQVRRNPVHRDEAFVCVACGRDVPAHGRTARDHCPFCLAGMHVDGDVPGDRASACGGVLEPRQAWLDGGRWVLGFVCRSCGAERRNQVILDGDPADDWELVVRLASRA